MKCRRLKQWETHGKSAKTAPNLEAVINKSTAKNLLKLVIRSSTFDINVTRSFCDRSFAGQFYQKWQSSGAIATHL